MIFNSTMPDGPMTGNPKFYKNKTREEIKQDLLERRKILGEKIGFDGTKILVPYQNIEKHKEGHFEDVTEFALDTLSDNPDIDLWQFDIPCDVMLIRSKVEGVALAYPVADCPVVIASTKDVIALAHCGAREIDRLVPFAVVDAVVKSTHVKEELIDVYVGPCASQQSYVYETYPNWATRKNIMWNNCINETKDGFKISLRKAIMLQLRAKGVRDIKYNPIDTITDSDYYSNYAANHGEPDKDGRFLVGAYFKPNILVKNTYRRKR